MEHTFSTSCIYHTVAFHNISHSTGAIPLILDFELTSVKCTKVLFRIYNVISSFSTAVNNTVTYEISIITPDVLYTKQLA